MNIKDKDRGRTQGNATLGLAGASSAGAPRISVSPGRMLKASLAGLTVFALAFVYLPYIIGSANAESVGGVVDWGAASITLDPDYDDFNSVHGDKIDEVGHGDVDFGTISPTSAGVAKIVKKTIAVETSGKYYAVYLSINDDAAANASYTTSDLTFYESDTDTVIPSIKIPAITGTYAAPSAFAVANGAAWGYASPDFNSANGGDGNWADKSYYEGNLSSTFDPAEPAVGTPTWTKVPLENRATGNVVYADLIYKDKTSAVGFGPETGQDSDYTFDVYYGVMVDDNVLAGTYKNEVVYTAVASAQDMDSASENVATGPLEYGGAGDEMMIRFDLTESVSRIQEGDVHVYLVPHTVMAATAVSNVYSITNLNPADYEELEITSFYSKLAGEESSRNPGVTLTVEMPVSLSAGKTDAEGNTVVAGTNDMIIAGDGFDFWVVVDGYNFNYVSHKTDDGTTIPAYTYVGLQTINSVSGKAYVNDMQEMTGGICKLTNRWNSEMGRDARIQAMGRDGVFTNLANTVTDSLKTPATLATEVGGDVTNAGTFELRDSRDGKLYAVRRLGDGECWMVQNLDLDLAAGMTFTSADTDISAMRGSWTLDTVALAGNVTTNAGHGSTGEGWQEAHGIETVSLVQGTWDAVNEQWVETTLETCGISGDDKRGEYAKTTAGTAQEPCFVNGQPAQREEYYTWDDSTKTLGTVDPSLYGQSTQEAAYVANENIYHKFVFDVMYAKYDNTAKGYIYVDATGGPNTKGDGSCTMYIDSHGKLLDEYGYCAVKTTGDPMVMQINRMNLNGSYLDAGYGMSSNWNHDAPRIVSVTNAASGVTVPVNSDGQSLISGGLVSQGDTNPVSSRSATSSFVAGSTSAIDWSWAGDARDGAHAYDHGEVMMTVKIGGSEDPEDWDDTSGLTFERLGGQTSTSGTSTTYSATTPLQGSASTSSKCSHVGEVMGESSGSLGGMTFHTCTDESGNPIASSAMVGNWYNFYAATAGDLNASATGQAESSICPAGWQLPADGPDSLFGSSAVNLTVEQASAPGLKKSFSNLLRGGPSGGTELNELSSAPTGYGVRHAVLQKTISSANLDTLVENAPLSFLRGGSLNWSNGYLYSRRSSGHYWSSYSLSSVYSRGLYFDSAHVYPRYSSRYHGYGFSLRCLARD